VTGIKNVKNVFYIYGATGSTDDRQNNGLTCFTRPMWGDD